MAISVSLRSETVHIELIFGRYRHEIGEYDAELTPSSRFPGRDAHLCHP